MRTGCTKAEILRHATIFCDTLRAAGYSGRHLRQSLLVDDRARRPGL
ncbi:MAG: hypothetical protein ACLUNO_12010 [Oscillospiraceae bacterium]